MRSFRVRGSLGGAPDRGARSPTAEDGWYTGKARRPPALDPPPQGRDGTPGPGANRYAGRWGSRRRAPPVKATAPAGEESLTRSGLGAAEGRGAGRRLGGVVRESGLSGEGVECTGATRPRSCRVHGNGATRLDRGPGAGPHRRTAGEGAPTERRAAGGGTQRGCSGPVGVGSGARGWPRARARRGVERGERPAWARRRRRRGETGEGLGARQGRRGPGFGSMARVRGTGESGARLRD